MLRSYLSIRPKDRKEDPIVFDHHFWVSEILRSPNMPSRTFREEHKDTFYMENREVTMAIILASVMAIPILTAATTSPMF